MALGEFVQALLDKEHWKNAFSRVPSPGGNELPKMMLEDIVTRAATPRPGAYDPKADSLFARTMIPRSDMGGDMKLEMLGALPAAMWSRLPGMSFRQVRNAANRGAFDLIEDYGEAQEIIDKFPRAVFRRSDEKIFVGRRGELHENIIDRNRIDRNSFSGQGEGDDVVFGFYDPVDGEFIEFGDMADLNLHLDEIINRTRGAGD